MYLRRNQEDSGLMPNVQWNTFNFREPLVTIMPVVHISFAQFWIFKLKEDFRFRLI